MLTSQGNAITATQICVWIWMVFVLVWIVAALRRKRTLRRETIRSRLFYSLPVFVAFVLLFKERIPLNWLYVRLYPSSRLISFIAVTLTACGIGFAIWARFYIGSNWSGSVTVKVDHQLIRTGPYSWVRHPIYSGILLGALGMAVAQREPRGFLCVIILWVSFTIKSRTEERFMRETFGSQYEDYRRTTPALMPRLH